jgi:hypothetical protein
MEATFRYLCLALKELNNISLGNLQEYFIYVYTYTQRKESGKINTYEIYERINWKPWV